MRSVRGLFWLQLAMGAAGIAAAALAVAAAAVAVKPEVPTSMDLRALCGGMISGVLRPGPLVVVGLAVIGLAVPVRGIRSVARRLRATRRLRRALVVEEIQPGRPALVIVRADRPLAFCAGLLRPRIYLSTGALQLLDEDERAAVVAHERHHARRRDPLRMLIAEALEDAVYFVPVLTRCRTRLGALAELAADKSAIAAVGMRPLAGALAAFDAHGGPLASVSNERVDHLQGARTDWGVERGALLAGLWSVAGLAAVAVASAASLGSRQVAFLDLASMVCWMLVTALSVLAAGLTRGRLDADRSAR